MSLNNDVINVLNILARKESWEKISQNWVRPPLTESSIDLGDPERRTKTKDYSITCKRVKLTVK